MLSCKEAFVRPGGCLAMDERATWRSQSPVRPAACSQRHIDARNDDGSCPLQAFPSANRGRLLRPKEVFGRRTGIWRPARWRCSFPASANATTMAARSHAVASWGRKARTLAVAGMVELAASFEPWGIFPIMTPAEWCGWQRTRCPGGNAAPLRGSFACSGRHVVIRPGGHPWQHSSV